MARLKEKHGMSNTKEYGIFAGAKRRCYNKNDQAYKYYGGRGIKFLFKCFSEFYNHIGPRPSTEYSLDRIDNNGNYEKGNVRWATSATQSANRRINSNTILVPCNNEIVSLRKAEKITGIGRQVLAKRYANNIVNHTELYADLYKNRKFCKNGHEFTQENTYIRTDRKGKKCRTCVRELKRILNAKKSKLLKENNFVGQSGASYE